MIMQGQGIDRRRRLLLAGVGLLLPVGGGWAQEQESDLAVLRTRGAISFALYDDNPPFSQQQGQQLFGLEVDLARAIAAEMGVAATFLPFRARSEFGRELRDMVLQGHYLGYGPADLMLHVPVDPALTEKFPQAAFLAPYLREQMVLVGRDAAVVASTPMRLLDYRIAAPNASAAASFLMLYRDGALQNKVKLYPDGIAATRAVLEGAVELAYVRRTQAEFALKEQPATGPIRYVPFQLPGMPVSEWRIGIAIKRERQKLAAWLEQTMQKMRTTGRLAELFTQYGLRWVDG